jgi:hypothetical protein
VLTLSYLAGPGAWNTCDGPQFHRQPAPRRARTLVADQQVRGPRHAARRTNAQVPATGFEPVFKRCLKPSSLPLDYAGVMYARVRM